MKDLFPEAIDKTVSGAEWWCGHWQCRNWRGFFQSREDGRGTWRFSVPWFSLDDVTCSLHVITLLGEIGVRDGIPIDSSGRITVMGNKYGREAWQH